MIGSVTSTPKSNYIQTKDGKVYEKPSTGQTVAAVLVADVAGGAAMKGTTALFGIPMHRMINKTTKLPEGAVAKTAEAAAEAGKAAAGILPSTEKFIGGFTSPIENAAYKEAAMKVFESSALPSKGVTILNAVKENEKEITDMVRNNFIPEKLQSRASKKVLEIFDERIVKPITESIVDGKNAMYDVPANKIVTAMDKSSIFSFHEIGHALNKNVGFFGKLLQKSRKFAPILSGIAITTALFKRKKAEGEEPGGWFDKTTTFIKNHAGKLAFLGMLPIVLEEGMASFKGAKLAKKFLSPELFKKMCKTNAIAGLTYVGLALGTGLAAFTVKKVRDAIASPKEV